MRDLDVVQSCAAAGGLCRNLFIRMVENTKIDWDLNAVVTRDRQDILASPLPSTHCKHIVADEVASYFQMLQLLLDIAFVLGHCSNGDHTTLPPPMPPSLEKVAASVTGWHLVHEIASQKLTALLEDWHAMVKRATEPDRLSTTPLRRSSRLDPHKVWWDQEKRRRLFQPDLSHSVPLRGHRDTISFDHIAAVIACALGISKPVLPFPAGLDAPTPKPAVNLAPSTPNTDTPLLKKASPLAHLFRRPSLRGDRPASAPCTPTTMKNTLGRTDVDVSARASSGSRLTMSHSREHSEPASFPRVPVVLPVLESPRWDIRRRAQDTLSSKPKFENASNDQYRMVPPEPGEENWRHVKKDNDPWPAVARWDSDRQAAMQRLSVSQGARSSLGSSPRSSGATRKRMALRSERGVRRYSTISEGSSLSSDRRTSTSTQSAQSQTSPMGTRRNALLLEGLSMDNFVLSSMPLSEEPGELGGGLLQPTLIDSTPRQKVELRLPIPQHPAAGPSESAFPADLAPPPPPKSPKSSPRRFLSLRGNKTKRANGEADSPSEPAAKKGKFIDTRTSADDLKALKSVLVGEWARLDKSPNSDKSLYLPRSERHKNFS